MVACFSTKDVSIHCVSICISIMSLRFVSFCFHSGFYNFPTIPVWYVKVLMVINFRKKLVKEIFDYNRDSVVKISWIGE